MLFEDSAVSGWIALTYFLIAGTVTQIWMRTHIIITWFSNRAWFISFTSVRDALGKQIRMRFQAEILSIVLSLLFGWCGGFVLGLVQIGRLRRDAFEA